MIVTTCKGRLDHLKLTLPTWLEHSDEHIIVVDSGCPQGAGAWARALEQHRVWGIFCSRQVDVAWNASTARNRALKMLQEHSPIAHPVLFLDADVMMTKRLELPFRKPKQFGLCVGPRDLDGVIALSSWRDAGDGFSERLGELNAFECIDFKLQLRLGLEMTYIKLDGFEAIEHGDDDRERYMADPLQPSRDKAWKYMVEKWGRLPLAEEEVKELFCRGDP